MKTYKTIRKLFDKENLFWKDNIELNLRYVRVMEICLVDFVKINGWGVIK